MARFEVKRESEPDKQPCPEAARDGKGWFVEFVTIDEFAAFVAREKRLHIGPGFIQIADQEW